MRTAQATHGAIKNALQSYDRWPPGFTYEVYLQGSYRNDTNVVGSSDVDVIVECASLPFHDTAALSAFDRWDMQTVPQDSIDNWTVFRRHVLRALRLHFGEKAVAEGKHSLKLGRTASHVPADVVPCLRYRQHRSRVVPFFPDHNDGITFWVGPQKRQVISFPKFHYQEGTEKNGTERTDGNYKPSVRAFKNAKEYMVAHGHLGEGVAPSYFLECLLYNVPDRCFSGSRQDRFATILSWLTSANLDAFVAQSHEKLLFGPSAQQWSKARATQTIASLQNLYNRGVI